MPSAAAVADRRMPPFLADATGSCGSFDDSLWLDDDEIETFVRWADIGAPEGILRGEPTAPPERIALEGVIATVDTGHDYLPDQSTSDDYRCFVVDSPGAFTVTGYDAVPSNPRIAHHLIMYQTSDDAAAAEARQLDEEAEGPGYPCFGTGPQVDATTVASWVPGVGVTHFPEGTGVTVDGSRPFILEMHYNIAGGPGETDRTEVFLQTSDAVGITQILEIAAFDLDFEGPPGLDSWTTTDETPISWSLADFGLGDYEGPLLVHGTNAHMHERGLSLRLEAPGAEQSCLLDVPRWDFGWQLNYWYTEPVLIDSASDLRISCEWTTQGLDEPLTWGDRTVDEMCLAALYVTIPEGGDE
jgi:hypothetical protein